MIADLKDLEKFLKICRKQGVTDISCAGVTVKLGEMASKPGDTADDDIQTPDALTDEQLAFFHVGGVSQ